MSIVAEVKMWDRTIGAVALEEDKDVAVFEYDPAFVGSGIEISPIKMPLSRKLYSFPALSHQSFHGLPGLLADSLPDRFGNALIDAWLATQGRRPESFNAVERLCYTGRRGMGALEFLPATGPVAAKSNPVEIDQLVELASKVLTDRDKLVVSFNDSENETAMREILRVGTSAGGARAKAVIAWNRTTGEVRSGQIDAGNNLEHWILKFDGVSGNRDKEMDDPQGYGLVEYAYYRMAIDAGINMNECRLFDEHGRRHFMTRRFDRLPAGNKLHMQTLGALAHYDFNMAGAYSYEQAFQVIRQFGLSMETIEQQFRRMVFNIVARNQDDHVKNIAFLMDKKGSWTLSPAYDVTYSFQPTGKWTSTHQMSMNGKRDGFTLEDFRTCARAVSMQRGRAEMMIEEVQAVVSHWDDYADEVGVPEGMRDKIGRTLRLEKLA